MRRRRRGRRPAAGPSSRSCSSDCTDVSSRDGTQSTGARRPHHLHTVSTGLACPREFNKRRHTYGALCAYFKLMLLVITILMHSCLPFTTRLGLRPLPRACLESPQFGDPVRSTSPAGRARVSSRSFSRASQNTFAPVPSLHRTNCIKQVDTCETFRHQGAQ